MDNFSIQIMQEISSDSQLCHYCAVFFVPAALHLHLAGFNKWMRNCVVASVTLLGSLNISDEASDGILRMTVGESPCHSENPLIPLHLSKLNSIMFVSNRGLVQKSPYTAHTRCSGLSMVTLVLSLSQSIDDTVSDE